MEMVIQVYPASTGGFRPSQDTASPPGTTDAAAVASDADAELVRSTNAYVGATNSINSIHQRKWFLSMDRSSSGFALQRNTATGRRTWVRRRRSDGSLGGFERFHVLGRDVERSIVTGRLAAKILQDEDVHGYVPRGLWRPSDRMKGDTPLVVLCSGFVGLHCVLSRTASRWPSSNH